MEELIAKRYVKALKNIFNADELAAVGSVFETIADEFKNESFHCQSQGTRHRRRDDQKKEV